MAGNSLKKRYRSTIQELGKSTTKDRIFAYYLEKDKIHLTEKEEAIRQRWEACFSLFCQYHSYQQVVSVMQQRFGISEAQAYRDCKSALDLFGNVTESDKKAYRHILFEFAMKIFQLAATKSDLTEMNRAVLTMVKIKGLDKDDPSIPDFGLLEVNSIQINLDQEQLNLINGVIKKGVVHIDDLIHGKDS